MKSHSIKERVLNENSSFIIKANSPEDRYIRKNFGGEFFTTKVDNNKKILTLKNSIGIIRLNDVNYRFYSKVDHLIKIFSMLEKLHRSDYPFKKSKKIWSFDPKVLVSIEDGSSFTIQLIDMFISELWKLKRIGFSKKYNSKVENINYLKGRLQIDKQIKKNIVPKSFYCKYNELNYYTPENLIVKETIRKILYFPINKDQRRELIFFKNEFNQLLNFEEKIDVCEMHFQQNRLNKHYESIIHLAEILLKGNFYSTLKKGENLFCNFLVKMDDLFERYIFLLIKELIENRYPNYSIEEQVSLNYIKKYDQVMEKDNGYLNMFPDIIIYNKNSKKSEVVIDTKYIDITNENKLNNNAYYQMLSYMFSLNLQNNSSVTGVLLSHGTSGNTYRINHNRNDYMYIYTEVVDLLSNEEDIKIDLISILDKVLKDV